MKNLEKLKNIPFYKIGLITEPPDFSFDEEIKLLRSNYNFIQIPTLLTDKKLLEEFNAEYGMNITDPLETLKNLTDYSYYSKFIPKHGEFVLNKMCNIKLYGPTVFHLPPMQINYDAYFDKVVVLRNPNSIDMDLLKQHVDEEGFPIEVEMQLLITQRQYFTALINTGIWNDSV